MKLILRLLLTGAFLLSCNWAFSGDIELKINKKYLNFPVSHKQERAKTVSYTHLTLPTSDLV